MPDPLAQLRRIRRDQDRIPALIVAALDDGKTGQQIADVLGLTKSRVYQIARAERQGK
jgi:DNA-directed RNA polymerase specialized sigma subunit